MRHLLRCWRRRMHRPPVLRDRCPLAKPDALMPLDVVEQALGGTDPPGGPDDPAVQADGQHAGAAFAAAPVKPVEGVAAITEEVLSRTEVTSALQTAVVSIKTVRKDELENIPDAHPVRKVIVVGIAVVQEAPELGDQPPRVRTGSAGGP